MNTAAWLGVGLVAAGVALALVALARTRTGRGLRVVHRPDGPAQVARSRRLGEIALTGQAVEIDGGRLVIPWEQVTAVRSLRPERRDGRPRRIALDVAGLDAEHRLLDRGRRTLVLPTAGLDADPAQLLAALDHYLELPGERAHLGDHDWAR